MIKLMVTISVVLGIAIPSLAQDRPTMGVLDAKLVGLDMDTTLRPLFTAAVRGTAVRVAKDSVDVIEGSKLDRMVQINVAECATSSCLANFARSVGVDYILETQMFLRKGNWTALLKLASARKESLLDEVTGDFTTEEDAKKSLPGLTEQVLRCFAKIPNEEGGTLDTVRASTPGAKKLVVDFSSVPSGAAVTLDGKFLCQTNTGKALLPGEHWIEMGKNGYRSRREKLTISVNGQKVSWSLDPFRTRLKLDAVDDRTGGDVVADVYADGERLGETPFDGLVPVTAGRIEVMSNEFGRRLVDVTLEEGAPAIAKVHFKSEKPAETFPNSGESGGNSKQSQEPIIAFLKTPSTWILGGILVGSVVYLSLQPKASENTANAGWTTKVEW